MLDVGQMEHDEKRVIGRYDDSRILVGVNASDVSHRHLGFPKRFRHESACVSRLEPFAHVVGDRRCFTHNELV
jgi:hypothetical protein